MKQDNEIIRIKTVYKNRDDQIPSHRYSFFKDVNLYFLQSRDKEILRLLKSAKITSFKNNKILDIGCGIGEELINLIRYGASPDNLYGIDLLENRIGTAKELCPNIHFTCSDASDLPYDNNSFDIVFQFTAFSSILSEKMKTLISQEMMRVVKPHGLIIWYDFHMNNPNNPDVRGVNKNDIYKLFSGCKIRLKRITLAPPIARILAPYSSILCHLIEKLGFLNTHYIGVIKKTRHVS